MENSSVASASSEAGSNRSQEIEELERFIDSYVLEYQVQGLLTDKPENDADSERTPPNLRWNEDFTDTPDLNWSSPKEKNSCKQTNRICNQEMSYDILGTDIWAVNSFEKISGATWDLQPEKLDFTTSFHRKHLQNSSKYLPHIEREGMVKGNFEEDRTITLNDLDKVLPVRTVGSESQERFNTAEMSRQCRNSCDTFCYICGEYTLKDQRRSMTALVKKAYELNFGCKIGDQDKPWAPHISCAT